VSIDPNGLVAVLLLTTTLFEPIVATLPSWSKPKADSL